jgi:hypothetical protein
MNEDRRYNADLRESSHQSIDTSPGMRREHHLDYRQSRQAHRKA